MKLNSVGYAASSNLSGFQGHSGYLLARHAESNGQGVFGYLGHLDDVQGSFYARKVIQGLSHITFIVRDLRRATQFFVDGLGATEIYSSGEHTFSVAQEKFFLLGGLWIAAMESEQAIERTYNHIALAAAPADLPTIEARLRGIGVEFRSSRPRVKEEGQSLYFYDFDNHLFELHSGTLDTRLMHYQATLPPQ